MHATKTTSIAILVLSLGGCVAPTQPLRTTMPTSTLTPNEQRALAPATLDFAAVPVAIDEYLVAPDIGGKRFPLYVRVPQGVPTTEATSKPSEEPAITGNFRFPQFDRRTVPILPFGTFFVAIANTSDHSLSFTPKDLSLRIAGKTIAPISDGGGVEGHWRRTLGALRDGRVGMPQVREAIRQLQASLPYLVQPVTLAPGQKWQGFAVFDVGAFTADEWNDMLAKAHTVWLGLANVVKEPIALQFEVKSNDLPVVCLPDTKQPSFTRCEVLVK